MYTEKVRLRLDTCTKKNPSPGIGLYRDERQNTLVSDAKVEMGILIRDVATSLGLGQPKDAAHGGIPHLGIFL